MSERPVLKPTAEHPIVIVPTAGRVRVQVNGRTIADTTSALSLSEAKYPPVQYIPFDDVDASLLTDSATTTYCPYKGEATYFTVSTGVGPDIPDAIWCYAHPHPAVAAIAGHVAFYPDKADITISQP